MENELKDIVGIFKTRMEFAIDNIRKNLSSFSIRKANSTMIEYIKIEYSGMNLALKEIATINVPDTVTLSIKPWNSNMLVSIYKTIIKLNHGFNTTITGDYILIKIPPLTEERRKQLVNEVKYSYEKYKINIRTLRNEYNKKLKSIKKIDEDLLNKYVNQINVITSHYHKLLDNLFDSKKKDILFN